MQRQAVAMELKTIAQTNLLGPWVCMAALYRTRLQRANVRTRSGLDLEAARPEHGAPQLAQLSCYPSVQLPLIRTATTLGYTAMKRCSYQPVGNSVLPSLGWEQQSLCYKNLMQSNSSQPLSYLQLQHHPSAGVLILPSNSAVRSRVCASAASNPAGPEATRPSRLLRFGICDPPSTLLRKFISANSTFSSPQPPPTAALHWHTSRGAPPSSWR